MATPMGFVKENPRGKLFGFVIRVKVLFISFVSQALIIYFSLLGLDLLWVRRFDIVGLLLELISKAWDWKD